MPTETLPGIQDWLNDYEKVFFEAMASSLGIEDCRRLGEKEAYPTRGSGAYLPLICDDEEIIIGLIAEPEGFQSLAKTFIQAEEGETLAEEDMADAVKELVNIAAGMLKTEAAKYKLTLKLGLPFFLDGHIKLTDSQETRCNQVQLGKVESHLVVIATRPKVLDQLASDPGKAAPAQRTSQEWLGEALTAAFTFSISTLGMEKYQVKKMIKTFPENEISGAYMPLIGDDDAILIGLLSNNAGLKEIGRALLQLPAQEPMEWDITVDAIKEALNILSGIVKQQLFKQNTTFKLALPFFIDGYIEVSENQEASAAFVEMGGTQTYLVIIKKRNQKIEI